MRRLALWLYATGVLIFLVGPLAVVLPISFNDSRFMQFPPSAYSARWYSDVLTSSAWLSSVQRSVVVGVIAAIIATVVGTLAALSLVRGAYPGKSLLRLIVMAPLIVPVIVLAIGVYDVYERLGLVGSAFGLGLAHAMLGMPFSVLVMSGALQNFDDRLEHAAWTLGAGRFTTFRLVTLPALKPAMLASALFAFIMSFDEIVVALFISGVRDRTLPVRIFAQLKTEVTPLVAAISVLLMIAVIAVFLLVAASRKADGRLRSR